MSLIFMLDSGYYYFAFWYIAVTLAVVYRHYSLSECWIIIPVVSESGKGGGMLLRKILKAVVKHVTSLMKEIVVLVKEDSKKEMAFKIDNAKRFL